MGELLERGRDGAARVGAGIDDLGGAERGGGDVSGAGTHPAVRERRAILDDEHPLALDGLGIVHGDG